MKTFPFLFLIVATLLLGCGSTDSNSSDPVATLPLKIGNSWNFENYSVKVETGDTSAVQEVTLTVVSDTVINGIKWFEIKHNRKFHDAIESCLTGYFSNQKDGVHRIRNLHEEDHSNVLYIPNPGFQTPLSEYSTDRTKYTINYISETTDTDQFEYVYRYSKSGGYELNPVIDLKFVLDTSSGIKYWETAYYSPDRNATSDDAPLVPHSRVYINQVSFTPAN